MDRAIYRVTLQDQNGRSPEKIRIVLDHQSSLDARHEIIE
jgi:hypothetical protein